MLNGETYAMTCTYGGLSYAALLYAGSDQHYCPFRPAGHHTNAFGGHALVPAVTGIQKQPALV